MSAKTKTNSDETKSEAPIEEQLAQMTVEELNRYADEEFDWENTEEITPPAPRKLDAAITVRFNSEELEDLRRRADAAGMKVTTFIREVTLQHAAEPVMDMEAVESAVVVLAQQMLVNRYATVQAAVDSGLNLVLLRALCDAQGHPIPAWRQFLLAQAEKLRRPV